MFPIHAICRVAAHQWKWERAWFNSNTALLIFCLDDVSTAEGGIIEVPCDYCVAVYSSLQTH